MRVTLALGVFIGLASCKSDPPIVNVNTVPPSGGDVSFTTAFDIDEGAALDLVVDPGKAGSMITTSMLPKNAVLKDGIFSFTPDYTQAGLYSITFTITAGDIVTTRTIGVRVLNVIHINAPPLTQVDEGGTTSVSFTSDDPMGTIVNYSAEITGITGATFDPVAAKLTFAPKFDWLDTRDPALSIIVSAEGQEIDTGKQRTSNAKVLYQINEKTSFATELVPLFLLPTGSPGTANIPSPTPDLESDSAHNCLSCHDGGPASPAGMDFHPMQIYEQLVNHDVADTGFKAAACGGLAANGVKRVVPGDLTKSLWFMKISGTDGNGNPGPPCGVQMPEGQQWYWWSVTDQDKWNACPPVAGEDHCREAYDCIATDVDCKTESRYVRKARIWIMDMAPNN